MPHDAEWQSGSSNILVVVRCRPLSSQEKQRKGDEEVVSITDGKTIEIEDPGHTATNLMRQKRLKNRAFAFDHSFSTATPTSEVYAKTTKFLVSGVMEGFNATVFAYGATGSGKTHTMLGNAASPGLMPSTLRDLWYSIGSRTDRVYTVTVSYVEIYNENIRDLLTATDEYLDLREDPLKVRRGTCVCAAFCTPMTFAAPWLSSTQLTHTLSPQTPTPALRHP
jgi:kinesin family protein 18/19